MTIRDQLVDNARSWLGTPFMHQARVKGVGADCGCLVEDAMIKFGFAGNYLNEVPEDLRKKYAREPNGTLEKILKTYLDEIHPDDRLPGDVALIGWVNLPQHVGVFSTKNRLIHAYESAGKVIEVTYSDALKRITRGVFRYKGL